MPFASSANPFPIEVIGTPERKPIAGEDTINNVLKVKVTNEDFIEPLGPTGVTLTPAAIGTVYDSDTGYDLRGYKNLALFIINGTDQAVTISIIPQIPGQDWGAAYTNAKDIAVAAGAAARIDVKDTLLLNTRAELKLTVAPTNGGSIKIFAIATK
jgi:hypothetical protein